MHFLHGTQILDVITVSFCKDRDFLSTNKVGKEGFQNLILPTLFVLFLN